MYVIKEHSPGLWILEEEEHNVLLKDCLKFGLTKVERVWLFQTLQEVVGEIQAGGSVQDFIEAGELKHLDRQKETDGLDVWEVRDPGRGGRIIFIREDSDSIVVAAVDKRKSSHSQAVSRGVKRWKGYLKEHAK